MIYVLIAGTYTPITLVTLRGSWGWTLFDTLWGIAVKPLFSSLATGGLILLLTGGLLYTFGTIFYVWKNLSYHHTIWHIFVIAGSTAHFFAIWSYMMPLPPVA